MAIYTYCLLRTPSDDAVPALRGIDSRPVFPLRCEKYTMLVSRLERDFAFTARSIVEHGQVIAKLFEERTVLPMRFGTFFRSEKQVLDLVRENRQSLLEAFSRLRGKAEMRLKLLLGFEPPKADQLRKPPRRAAATDDFEGGMEESLDPQSREAAEQLAVRLREMFRPLDQQVTCRRLDSSQLLVDCAHLIEAGQVNEYQRLCGQAVAEARDLALRVTGPWPPYHFLPTAVKLPSAATIAAIRYRPQPRVASLSH